MTTYVSRRMHMFKIIAFFMRTPFAQVYTRGDILFKCKKYLQHDRIIPLRGEVWDHQASLPPPLFIEVPVPSPESERSCICVVGVSICFFLRFFILFWNCSDIVLILLVGFVSLTPNFRSSPEAWNPSPPPKCSIYFKNLSPIFMFTPTACPHFPVHSYASVFYWP